MDFADLRKSCKFCLTSEKSERGGVIILSDMRRSLMGAKTPPPPPIFPDILQFPPDPPRPSTRLQDPPSTPSPETLTESPKHLPTLPFPRKYLPTPHPHGGCRNRLPPLSPKNFGTCGAFLQVELQFSGRSGSTGRFSRTVSWGWQGGFPIFSCGSLDSCGGHPTLCDERVWESSPLPHGEDSHDRSQEDQDLSSAGDPGG